MPNIARVHGFGRRVVSSASPMCASLCITWSRDARRVVGSYGERQTWGVPAMERAARSMAMTGYETEAAMRRLSESLVELAARAEELEDAAADALEADRSTLEKRRRDIEKVIDAEIDALERTVHDVSATGRKWWEDTRAAVARQVDTMRSDYERRQSQRRSEEATRAADMAERDAAAAVALASYYLNVAEYAVLDAELARADADDLAGGAPVG